MYGEGAAFPREDPGGSTSLLIQLHQGLIPATEEQVEEFREFLEQVSPEDFVGE